MKTTQFRIVHLLAVTLLLAFLFAIARIIGAGASMLVLAMAYLAAPTIAFLASRYGRDRRERYALWIGIVSGMLVIAAGFSAVSGGAEAAVSMVLGTICCWLPQSGMIYVVYSGYRSGLRSAGLNLDQVRPVPVPPANPPATDGSNRS